MDPIAAALCGVGATIVLFGHTGSLAGWLMLAAGFYGIARASGSRAAPWLVGAVAVAFGFAHLKDVVALPFTFDTAHPTIAAAPHVLQRLVLDGAFLAAVVIARHRVGMGLFVLAVVAGAMSITFGALADLLDPKPEPANFLSFLSNDIAGGWGLIASRLDAVVFLVAGVGAPVVTATPRRASAIVGVVSAALLATTLSGFPHQGHEGDAIAALATAFAAWIAMAVAIGRLRGIGGGGAAIAGMVLAILQVLAIGLVTIALDDMREQVDVAFTMGLGLGFLGLGIAVFVPSALPLQNARFLIGGAFLVASSGATIALLKHLGKVRMNPYWGATEFAKPAGALGFALLAAYFAFLVSPPAARDDVAVPR